MEEAAARQERLRAIRESAQRGQQGNEEHVMGSVAQQLLPPDFSRRQREDTHPGTSPGFNFYTDPLAGFAKRKVSESPSHRDRHRAFRPSAPPPPQFRAPHNRAPQFPQFRAPPPPILSPFQRPLPPFDPQQQFGAPPLMPVRPRAPMFPNTNMRGNIYSGNTSGGRGRGRGRGRIDNGGRGWGSGRIDNAGRGRGEGGVDGKQFFRRWMLDDPWKDLSPFPLPGSGRIDNALE